MSAKLPRGRHPQRSLLKGIWGGGGGKLQHSFGNVQIQDNSKSTRKNPVFPAYTWDLCAPPSSPEDAGFAGLPAPHTALRDARPSLAPIAGGSREGGCHGALGVSSSSVPSTWAPEQNLCISPPVSKHRCRKGSCTPVVTHQQSSPLPRTP